MMKTLINTVSATALLLTSSVTMANDSNASRASTHGSQAVKYSALAVGDSASTGARVSKAVVAAPLMVVGFGSLAAGSASVQAAESLSRSKVKPLEISDDVVIAGPAPKEAVLGR
ncbi:hypothetical protein [Flocculibacter collagenilyticus]|uniref:hypothetical protein n=1 Tax=Flocculibacter collagenilyticus TaxID=2744479 RepID=UPI0018F6A4E6|nr:hypothetical protein [Flocculibacter collagenilyticus]